MNDYDRTDLAFHITSSNRVLDQCVTNSIGGDCWCDTWQDSLCTQVLCRVCVTVWPWISDIWTWQPFIYLSYASCQTSANTSWQDRFLFCWHLPTPLSLHILVWQYQSKLLTKNNKNKNSEDYHNTKLVRPTGSLINPTSPGWRTFAGYPHPW